MPGSLVTRAEWNALATAQRLELMLDRSLTDCWEVLEHPIGEALERRDAVILNTKIQVIRAVLHTCTKLGIEQSRAFAEREKVLGAMAADLRQSGRE